MVVGNSVVIFVSAPFVLSIYRMCCERVNGGVGRPVLCLWVSVWICLTERCRKGLYLSKRQPFLIIGPLVFCLVSASITRAGEDEGIANNNFRAVIEVGYLICCKVD